MAEPLPKVSILIATYNQRAFIAECIASALNQTYENLEIVVSDDASTDETETIARSLLTDPRLRYQRNPTNLGRVGNYRRLLFELAAGDWVLMLDGDDYLTNPDYIAHAVGLAMSAPGTVLIFGQALEGPDVASARLRNAMIEARATMDGNAFFLRHPPFFDLIPLHITCLFRRDLAVEADFYKYDVVAADLESLYRLILGRKVGLLDEVSGLWRRHSGNATNEVSLRSFLDDFAVFAETRDAACRSGEFSDRQVTLCLRRGFARYYLFCLRRLLVAGRFGDALRLTGQVMKLDPGILVHAIARLVSWVARGFRPKDRVRLIGQKLAN